MLGLIIVGCATGLIATVAALSTGASYGMAFLTYCVAGSTGMVVTAAARAGLAELHLRRNPEGISAAPGSEILAESPEIAPLAPLPVLDVPPPGLRILAVDDDPFIRELVPMISAEAGFPNVMAAASSWDALALLGEGLPSGSEAEPEFAPELQLARESLLGAELPSAPGQQDKRFDCLLLDIDMPDMNGIELCRRVRSIPAYRDVPIIMLTALRDMKHLDSAFRAGATDYTTKPFDIIEFGARLRLAQDRIEAQANRDSADPESPIHAGLLRPGSQLGTDQQIPGMANLIEQRSLSNYLSQLHRNDLPKTAVMAVQIDQTEVIAPTVSTRQRIAVLHDVAASISAVVGAEQCQIAYGGHGIFLLVAQEAAIASRDIEVEINRMMAQSAVGRLARTEAEGLTVSVGEPIQPSGRKAQRAELAFKRAVLAVNHRKLFHRSQLQLLSAAR